MFAKIDGAILFATRAAVAALLALMLGATLAGVFWRYALGDALTWSEEAARYAMVWLALLGGGLAFREGGHVAMDLLVTRIGPRRLRAAVVLLAQGVALAVLAVLVWQGAALAERGARMTTPALRLPMSLPYAALPAGGALMIYHLCAAAVSEALGRDAPRADDAR